MSKNDVSNVYIYMGENKREGYSWHEYMGLEQAKGDNYKYVLEKEREQFEKEHIIFKPKKGEDTKEFYKNVRAYYLSNLVDKGPSKAIDNTTEKYSK